MNLGIQCFVRILTFMNSPLILLTYSFLQHFRTFFDHLPYRISIELKSSPHGWTGQFLDPVVLRIIIVIPIVFLFQEFLILLYSARL